MDRTEIGEFVIIGITKVYKIVDVLSLLTR